MGMPFRMCGSERPHQVFSDGDDVQVGGWAAGRKWARKVVFACSFSIMTEHLPFSSFIIDEGIHFIRRNLQQYREEIYFCLEVTFRKEKLGQEPTFFRRILYLDSRISTKYIFRL